MAKYRKPPIGEAVCELRFIPSAPWDLAVPGLIYERLRTAFPKRRQLKVLDSAIQLQTEATLHQFVTTDRLQCVSEDEKDVVGVGPNVLAISRLDPYKGWEQFRPTIMRALEAYSEVTSPKALQRAGLRYVNRITFDEKSVELSDFFDFYPFVGKSLPQDFGPFVVGIQTAYNDDLNFLRVNLASAFPPPKPLRLSVVLDIDYFLGKPEGVAIADIEQWLNQGHDRVASAFEGSIKDVLRARFEEEKA
jgi:uncharacterized protein (TIGR04255 family)